MISGRPCRARASLNLTASEKNFLVCRHWHHLPVVLRRCHLWRGLSSLLSLDSSQNYRIKINSCIHRVACGTTAYFYTDSYTTDEALIEASSPVFLCPVPSPLLAPCSLFPCPCSSLLRTIRRSDVLFNILHHVFHECSEPLDVDEIMPPILLHFGWPCVPF